MPEYEKTTIVKTKIKATPCIKCGGTDLEFWQDRKYALTTVTCQCGFQVRGSISWEAENAEIVEKVWNPANDKRKAIDNIDAQIAALKAEKIRIIKSKW